MEGREEPYSIKTETQETYYYVRSKGQSLRKTNRCPKCGKAHDILMFSEETSVYFKYGELEHFFRDCTQHSNAPELHVFEAKKDKRIWLNKTAPRKSRCHKRGKNYEVVICPEKSAVWFNYGKSDISGRNAINQRMFYC